MRLLGNHYFNPVSVQWWLDWDGVRINDGISSLTKTYLVVLTIQWCTMVSTVTPISKVSCWVDWMYRERQSDSPYLYPPILVFYMSAISLIGFATVSINLLTEMWRRRNEKKCVLTCSSTGLRYHDEAFQNPHLPMDENKSVPGYGSLGHYPDCPRYHQLWFHIGFPVYIPWSYDRNGWILRSGCLDLRPPVSAL